MNDLLAFSDALLQDTTQARENEYREYLIRDARMDPRTYIETVFKDEKGTPVLLGDIHEELFGFMLSNQYGVIELPREHGKTTSMLGFISWLIGKNPNNRIKIVASSDGIAVSRGKAIREILESPAHCRIFPRTAPGREWSDKRLSVARSIITPESTLECYGVGSKATGGRCDWLFPDDIDDEEVVVSDAKRIRNRERLLNVWLNLLPPDGHSFAFATPWHEADSIHTLKNNGWPTFRKPVVNMTPVWPERWGRRELEARRRQIGSLAFARGFELVPITSETAPIKGIWFKLWTSLPRFTQLIIVVDPNNSLSETADYTCIGVLGVTYDFQVYLLEVDRRHFEFPGLMTAILDIAAKAEIRYKMTPTIGVEDTAFQRAVPQQLKRESKYPIVGLKADKSKFIRASRLAVHIENGRVNLKGLNNQVHPEQQKVYDECVSFPSGATVDCVDMLGYGVEMALRVARRTGAVVA